MRTVIGMLLLLLIASQISCETRPGNDLNAQKDEMASFLAFMTQSSHLGGSKKFLMGPTIGGRPKEKIEVLTPEEIEKKIKCGLIMTQIKHMCKKYAGSPNCQTLKDEAEENECDED